MEGWAHLQAFLNPLQGQLQIAQDLCLLLMDGHLAGLGSHTWPSLLALPPLAHHAEQDNFSPTTYAMTVLMEIAAFST